MPERNPVRIGITLPTFEPTATAALARARAGEEAGIDGLFVFDHLWPIGDPARPALAAFPVLGAVAAVTSRTRLGPLVARIGLVPDEVVESSLVSLQALSGGRVVAGLGIGDDKSLPENQAYGIETRSVAVRRRALGSMLASLQASGIECWVGANATATIEVARAAGAAVNLWAVPDERVALEAARGPVTWGGPLPAAPRLAAERLAKLSDAGATWVIWAWPPSIEAVVEAAALAGAVLGSE